MGSAISEEIVRFNALAETWWDDTGPMWPLHRLNALREPFILRHIRSQFGCQQRSDFDRLEVLDIGCGGGLLSESVARTGASVLGIDAAERNIRVAQHRAAAGDLPLEYSHTTVESLDAGRQFDVVLNMEVVEHVADVNRFMNEAAARTRPGGLMFVATINRTLYSAITAKFGAEYILRWLPKGTHQWHKFVRPGEIDELLGTNGFTSFEITGVAVNPFTRTMSLTRYLGGNYMLAAKRQSG